MKKCIIKVLLSLSVLSFIGGISVNAYYGSIEDNLISMIYWSQGGGTNMYWTGVTNKVNYDYYRPCVGPANSEYSCGVAAPQSVYKEYGLWLSNSVNTVVHGLTTASGSYSSLEYPVEVHVSAADR